MEEALNLTRCFPRETMDARRPHDPASRFYDAIWERKARTPTGALAGREANALPFIPPRSRLLDVGSGRGTLLERAPSPALAVGAEIARPALADAQRRGLRVVRADLEGPYLPFRDGAFDRVTCLDVIEHLFDPRPLLAEIRRVLAPGGMLILQTPNVRHYLQLVRIAVRGRGPRTSGDPEGIDGGHIHYFTARDVAELLRAAGFARVRLGGSEGVRFLPGLRSLGVLALAEKAT